MRKKEHEPRSAAEKCDERLQIEPGDAGERRHPGRWIVSCGIADLSSDPARIAPGADFRQVDRAYGPEFAEAMAVDATLPDEQLLAAVRARARPDDRAEKQTEDNCPSHEI